MSEISYYFAIITLKDGSQWPSIKVHDIGKYRLIEGLGTMKMQKLGQVRDFISEVEGSSTEQKTLLYHDNLTLEIEVDEVKIFEDSTDTEPCILTKSKLLEILLGWHDFLLAYENNSIPGVIHPDKRGLNK